MSDYFCSNHLCSTVAIGFSGYLSVFFPHQSSIVYAVILIIILSIVNFYGIRESAWTNSILTLVEVSGLVIIIIAGFLIGSGPEINLLEFPKMASVSYGSTILALLTSTLIFFAYYGFENISNISEETRNPTRIIPKALLISILITSIIYVLVSISSIVLVGWKEFCSSEAPLAVVATPKTFGNYGIVMLTVIALFATTNTVLMMLVSEYRIIFGMARDGAIPSIFSNIQKNTRTPWVATFAIMIFTIATVVLSLGNIVMMASLSVFGIFVVFAFVNFSLIWLRFKQPNLVRTFTSPFKIKKFPILAGIGLLTSIIMIFEFDKNITSQFIGHYLHHNFVHLSNNDTEKQV